MDNLSRGKYDIYLKKLLRRKNVQFIKKNLTKEIKINISNISHIFHLAGSVGVKNINKNPYQSFLSPQLLGILSLEKFLPNQKCHLCVFFLIVH